MRIDLPEIEDQPWCPRWVRDALTGYLEVALSVGRPYDDVAPIIAEVMREADESRIVDLASGGGGPWGSLLPALHAAGAAPSVTLTDLHPNEGALARLVAVLGVRYERRSVSATAVPPELGGVRTMFTALHHFDRDGVAALMRAAQRDRVPFVAAEATQRSLVGVLTLLFIPLMVLLLMPRVRPFRWSTIVFTYLAPVLPLAIWWDGIASTLRSWSATELEEIAAATEKPGYRWEVRELRGKGPIPRTVLVGRPEVLSRP